MKTTVSRERSRGGEPTDDVLTWTLSLVAHPDRALLGRALQLVPERSLTLGRGSRLFGGRPLDHERVSRAHAELTVTAEDDAWLVDLESRNGTYLNGRRVERALLREGDLLAVADLVWVVHRLPLAPPAVGESGLVGVSRDLRGLVAGLRGVAGTSTPVTLVGPVGAGKSAAARALHRLSGREGRLVTLDLAISGAHATAAELVGQRAGALVGVSVDRVGALAESAGGTLVLSGLPAASAETQAALRSYLEHGTSRALGDDQDRAYDSRVVVLTTSPLRAAVEAGELRADLAPRLSHAVFELPPLDARPEDVAMLAGHFATKHAGASAALSAGSLVYLTARAWPAGAADLEAAVAEACRVAADPTRIEVAVEADAPTRPGAQRLALRVAPDASWFVPPGGARVDLEPRPLLQRLLVRLVEAHRSTPEHVVSMAELIEAGWPGERLVGKSGANRVYVALSALRKLGLREVLESPAGGYRISAETSVQVE